MQIHEVKHDSALKVPVHSMTSYLMSNLQWKKAELERPCLYQAGTTYVEDFAIRQMTLVDRIDRLIAGFVIFNPIAKIWADVLGY